MPGLRAFALKTRRADVEDREWPGRHGAGVWIAVAATAGLLLRITPLVWDGGLAVYGISYDEGVYFSASALLARGILPYRDYVLVHPPGLPVLLSPLAALAWRTDPFDVFVLARAAAVGVGVANIVLVGRLSLRLFGPFAAVAAAVLYATHPETVREERGVFLEPYLNLLCLGLAWFWLVPGRRGATAGRTAVAGLVGGLGVGVKIWGGLWIAAALATPPPARRFRCTAALGLGAIAGAAIVVLPFALADADALLLQVVTLQMQRPPQGLSDPALRLAHIAALSALALPGVALALSRRETNGRAGLFFAVAYLTTAAAFLLSPVYFLRYVSHLAAASSILGGMAAARLHGATRGRASLSAAAPALLALVATFQTAVALEAVRRYRVPEQEPLAAAIRSAVPRDSCLFSMEPGWSIRAGRLPEPHRGVPLVVDAHAWRLLALASAGGRQPGSTHGAEAAANAAAEPAMRRLLESCRFLAVGRWGLAPEIRSWVAEDWTRLHPAKGEAGPELWKRGGPRRAVP